ncbi:hypothetical protein ACT453_16560, partial [Bacillus sp. D-CC]
YFIKQKRGYPLFLFNTDMVLDMALNMLLDLVMVDIVIHITRILLIIQVTNKIRIMHTIPIKMRRWKRRGKHELYRK